MISRKKIGARANWKGNVGIVGIVDFKDKKNLGEDDARADIRDSADTKRMLDFKGIKIAGYTNVNQFGPESVNSDAGLVDLK